MNGEQLSGGGFAKQQIIICSVEWVRSWLAWNLNGIIFFFIFFFFLGPTKTLSRAKLLVSFDPSSTAQARTLHGGETASGGNT